MLAPSRVAEITAAANRLMGDRSGVLADGLPLQQKKTFLAA